MPSIPNPKIKNRPIFQLWNRERDLKILKSIAIVFVIAAASINIKDKIVRQFSEPAPEDSIAADVAAQEENNCNVFGIALHGDLVTYIPASERSVDSAKDQTASEDIVYGIEKAEKDEKMKAIALEVDSLGGYPVAGEEVADALKKVKKPTVAIIRQYGDSAAYMAASGADRIFASKNSDVGSIAVTMSYLDYVRQNQKDGLTYVSLSSGKFKDTGDPNKILSREEKNLLMRDINAMHKNFVKAVAENRKLEIAKVEKLADGSTMLGEMALRNGLVDEIGGEAEAMEYLKGVIGEEAEVCW